MERLFRTFPDRLIKERRLAGIRTREAANRCLQRDLPTYHRRFRRTLRQDNTLQGAGKGYVVTEAWRIRRPQPGTIVETLNGQRLVCHGAPPRASRERAPQPPAAAPRFPWPSRHRAVIVPKADHPWRSDSGLRSRRALELVQYGALNPKSGDLVVGENLRWDQVAVQQFFMAIRSHWRGWHSVLFLDKGSPTPRETAATVPTTSAWRCAGCRPPVPR